MTIEYTAYGFSTPTAELEQILELKPGTLARTGLDMDLADHCRMLAGEIDLTNEAAVRTAFAKVLGPVAHADYTDPRYINALVRVARDFSQAKEGSENGNR
jgi:hypothetical protein